MAKQTINIGASPNDGTGTPLRTAFDYTNQNFTELYTATGPSGNNIVVPGNATITGDLTVRTNKLAVTSTGVGCGTTTPALPFVVSNGGAQGFEINPNGSIVSGGIDILSYNRSTSVYKGVGFAAESYLFRVGTVSATDAMTLNSTGLGVGTASHSTKLGVVDAGNTFAATFRGNGGTNFVAIGTTGFGASINGYTAGFAASADLVLQPNGGNVGIGVTPSAWGGTAKAIQIGSYSGIYNDVDFTVVVNNAFFNGTNNIYRNTAPASQYYQQAGSHVWRTAPSGTAGNPITGANAFVQAMTLDASGNFLVGTTSTSTSSGSGFKVTQPVAGHFDAFVVTSANSSIYSCWDIYSTGGTAGYRFFVTATGTVNAVNATISAISDARLKENVQDLDVGLNEVLALKPRKFDWKAGKGKGIKGDRGFIAQEFETVFPNLIDEWKDEAPEGEAPYKSVRQDLIPVLVKAIQELTARVQTLEAK